MKTNKKQLVFFFKGPTSPQVAGIIPPRPNMFISHPSNHHQNGAKSACKEYNTYLTFSHLFCCIQVAQVFTRSTIHGRNSLCFSTPSELISNDKLNLKHYAMCQPSLETPSFFQPCLIESGIEHQYALV